MRNPPPHAERSLLGGFVHDAHVFAVLWRGGVCTVDLDMGDGSSEGGINGKETGPRKIAALRVGWYW